MFFVALAEHIAFEVGDFFEFGECPVFAVVVSGQRGNIGVVIEQIVGGNVEILRHCKDFVACGHAAVPFGNRSAGKKQFVFELRECNAVFFAQDFDFVEQVHIFLH